MIDDETLRYRRALLVLWFQLDREEFAPGRRLSELERRLALRRIDRALGPGDREAELEHLVFGPPLANPEVRCG